MKNLLLLIIAISLCSVSVNAQEEGFKVSLRGGVALSQKTLKDYYSLDVILGYQFDNSVYVGLGTGFNNTYSEWYSISDGPNGSWYGGGPDYLLPLFARVKYDFLRRRLSPYLAVDAGYIIPVTGNNLKSNGGFICLPAVGVDFFVDKRLKRYISFQVGVFISKTTQVMYNIETMYRPDFKLGFTF